VNCGHAIFYTMRSAGVARCLICNPPASRPARIGLRLPNGRIKTRLEFLAEIVRHNRTASTRAAVAAVQDAWPEAIWELIEHDVDGAGWPWGSQRAAPVGDWKKWWK